MFRRAFRGQHAAFLVAIALVAPVSAHAQASPEHPRRGVGMMLQGAPGGPLEVHHVMPGSPAAKAGAKAGDQVLSIAGLTADELNPDKLRAISDTARSLRVVVLRDGIPLTMDLEPAILAPPSGAPQQ